MGTLESNTSITILISMEFSNLSKSHRSIRDFKPDHDSEQVLKQKLPDTLWCPLKVFN
jgi:hypothetical protein